MNTLKSLFACGLVFLAAVRGWAAAADDTRAVEGKWQLVAAELGGRAMPDAVIKITRMKLEGGRYEVVAESPDFGTYTTDATTTPKAMTVSGTEGPNKGKTFPCIYEIDGDTLRICYDLSGKKRPAEFKTEKGTLLYLATFKRAKS